MDYLNNVIKSYAFSTKAIQELSNKKFVLNIIYFLICSFTIISVKILIISVTDYNILLRQIIYSFLFLICEIFILFMFLNKCPNKKNTIMKISQAFLTTDFFFTFMIFFRNKELPYKLINGIINIYILYYVYRFLIITIPEINKRKLELSIILSALLSNILVTVLFILYNSIFVQNTIPSQ